MLGRQEGPGHSPSRIPTLALTSIKGGGFDVDAVGVISGAGGNSELSPENNASSGFPGRTPEVN